MSTHHSLTRGKLNVTHTFRAFDYDDSSFPEELNGSLPGSFSSYLSPSFPLLWIQ